MAIVLQLTIPVFLFLVLLLPKLTSVTVKSTALVLNFSTPAGTLRVKRIEVQESLFQFQEHDTVCCRRRIDPRWRTHEVPNHAGPTDFSNASDRSIKVTGEHRSALLQVLELTLFFSQTALFQSILTILSLSDSASTDTKIFVGNVEITYLDLYDNPELLNKSVFVGKVIAGQLDFRSGEATGRDDAAFSAFQIWRFCSIVPDRLLMDAMLDVELPQAQFSAQFVARYFIFVVVVLYSFKSFLVLFNCCNLFHSRDISGLEFVLTTATESLGEKMPNGILMNKCHRWRDRESCGFAALPCGLAAANGTKPLPVRIAPPTMVERGAFVCSISDHRTDFIAEITAFFQYLLMHLLLRDVILRLHNNGFSIIYHALWIKFPEKTSVSLLVAAVFVGTVIALRCFSAVASLITCSMQYLTGILKKLPTVKSAHRLFDRLSHRLGSRWFSGANSPFPIWSPAQLECA